MDIQRIDFNLLKVFRFLLEERQVSRAAQRLNLSQPAVSHALKRLRELFEDPLFIAEGRVMRPTPKALALGVTIEQVWQTLESGFAKVSPFDPKTSARSFRIAVSSAIEYAMVARIYRQLLAAGPKLSLEVVELIQQDYWQPLGQGQLDLVVGFADGDHLHPKLSITPWFDEPLCCLGTESLDQQGFPMTAEQLVARPHIYTSSWGHSQTLVNRWLKAQQLSRTIAIRVPSFMAVTPLLSTNNYHAVVPQTIGKLLTAGGTLTMHPLPDSLIARYCLATHPLYQKDPAIIWFIELLQGLVESHAKHEE
jgi:DNA-binding transcriptional LysR family regulator